MSMEDWLEILDLIDKAANDPPKKTEELIALYMSLEWIEANADVTGVLGFRAARLLKRGRSRVRRILKQLSTDDYELLARAQAKRG